MTSEGKITTAQDSASNLVRGKSDKFSQAMLIELATRAGYKMSLEVL
jgi:predicted XRE-type DNA-binding protein